MARIVGNLAAEDDGLHPLGPEPNFNESMYFNFFDPERGAGGFVRLGNRANEGYAERTVALFLPGGRALFHFARPKIADNERFDAGGLRFEVLEATERLRTRYTGPMLDLPEPELLAEPRRAFAESPRRELELDLTHVAVGPLYGQRQDPVEVERAAEEQFARAHYEQHMAVEGSLAIEGEAVIPIRGFGLRDHSWGPRYWQAIESHDWLTLNFGPDFGAMVSRIQRSDGSEKRAGVVVRGEEVTPLASVEIETEHEPGGLRHHAVTARVETRDGEGMTEWRCGDRLGFGLSELLRQVR